MLTIHPLKTTNLIRESYIRYLNTAYPFQEVELRQQFQQALNQPDMVVKGPLLEASPPFELGRNVAQLIEKGILHPDFRALASGQALPLDRPLYRHQEQAVTKVSQGQRNLIVATGTGSGKTECFLIPILDHLLRERAADSLTPGVRALLLYPMNALANDQLKRLRAILADFPDITFGRYTGETKDGQGQAETSFRNQFPREPLLKNELISRSQMQKTPPHILLTNYAMLEYLLLRPRDNVFFDGAQAQAWRFIVLDEAHIYNGALGAEIAMLMRRLKDRVVQSETGRLRCLATSATLGEDKSDYPASIKFAQQLFAETFEWQPDDPDRQDIVTADRIDPSALGPVWGAGQPAFYTALANKLRTADQGDLESSGQPNDRKIEQTLLDMLDIGRTHALPAEVLAAAERNLGEQPEPRNALLYALLEGDQRLRHLQTALSQEPHLLSDLGKTIFSDQAEGDPSNETLVALIDLAAHARPTPNDSSLLPARYHVFARALEGVFVCLNHKAHAPDQPYLFLNRHETCPHCENHMVELATCRHCGATYVVGQLSEDRHLHQIDEIEDKMVYFVLKAASVGLDEDEAIAAGEEIDQADDQLDPYTLCLGCGAIAEGQQDNRSCNCVNKPRQSLYRINLQGKSRRRIDPQDKGRLKHCLTCGSLRSGGVAQRFLTGQDAPVSVLAAALYQNLPPARNPEEEYPGQGRKLLSFADSRQNAAFFAPYLERTYNQILRRRLILMAVTEDEAGQQGKLRLQDVRHRLLRVAERADQFTQGQSFDEQQQTMYTWLMQELIAIERRNSLEGVGFLRFRLVQPQGWEPPQPLLSPPWNFSKTEAWDLICLLLDTLRQQGAVQFPDQVDPRSADFEPRNRPLYVRGDQSDKGIYSWKPTKGSNRRLDFLTKLLSRRETDMTEMAAKQAAKELLHNLWSHLSDPNGVWRAIMVPEHYGKQGIVYRLSYQFWEVVPTREAKVSVYRCQKCRSIAHVNLNDICPAYRCQETLAPIDELEQRRTDEQHHYQHLYTHLDPIPFQAQEHTAQWKNDEASKVQDRFVRGELNCLSCSTTFELGVDVGDLQAVLMRNVPPTTANYVQRAGRAGRRTDSAAFALTYAQRRSHDLAHYARPKDIVAGHIRPPIISLTNEKLVRRHVHSVLFADFFHKAMNQENRSFRNVGDFFIAPEDGDKGPTLLRQYAETYPEDLKAALVRIVPPDLQSELALADWGWLGHLWADPDRPADKHILDLAAGEVEQDLATLEELEGEAATAGKYKQADYFKRVGYTIRKRNLVDFLGTRSILPKYGFPSDVVELRTLYVNIPEANQVELQRDLKIALSEYAPGAEIVAAKKVWKSGGIYTRPDRDLPQYNYAICKDCNRFHRALNNLPSECQCGGSLTGHPYIIPEFGFIVAHSNQSKPRPSGEQRPRRIYASRTYFANYDTPTKADGTSLPLPDFADVEDVSSSQGQIAQRYSRYGLLALVNAGPDFRGFRICQTCGFTEPNQADDVKKRRGRKTKAKPHANPRTGYDCRGTMKTLHLGHQFITDVLELQFQGRLAQDLDYPQGWSILFALLEGASHALGIRRDDLDGTLYQQGGGGQSPSLILFDNVPGGAGHVQRVATELPATLQAAYGRVNKDCCGAETSCNECLRNFRNQPFHKELKRGVARDFLGAWLGALRVDLNTS